MLKIDFSYNNLIPQKRDNVTRKYTQSALPQCTNALKSDIFVKQNISFCKKKKIQIYQEKPFIERLKDLYRERGFKEIGNLSHIFAKVKTKEENQFLRDYIDKNQSHFTPKVLENITSEFKEFREKNHRSMNQEELDIFKDFIIGLEYRTKADKMHYGGDIIHELIPLAKNPQDKEDIINLLENRFVLYDDFFLFDDDKKSCQGQSIGRLLEYKHQNPEIANLIIPYATKYTEKGQTFSQVREFFDYYKQEDKPKELIELSKNPHLSFPEIKNFYENYMRKASPLCDVIKKSLLYETHSFFKLAEKALKEYPELADDLRATLEYSEDFNPNIASLYGKKDKTLYEILAPIQRLGSRKEFHYNDWPIRNKFLIDYATKIIRSGATFDYTLDKIANNYKLIFPEGTGKNRGEKREYKHSFTPYSKNNYGEYKSRFDKLVNNSITPPYEDICTSQFVKTGENVGEVRHPHLDLMPNFMKHAQNSYEAVMPYVKMKSFGHSFTEKELKKIDDNIAEIQYLMSIAQPFKRGTAGITNILVRSLYKSLGITLPPTRFNVSLDLEAFCTPLAEYKQKWKTFFEE